MYAQSFSISQSLHEKALKVVASYFKAEAELIDVLQKIDSVKAFRDLGYSSLFTYATQGLKLPENTAYSFIEKAKDLSQKKLEKELAKEFPKTATPEKVSYITETRLQVSLGISEELMKKLKRAQDLVSQSTSKSVTLEQTLEKMLEQFLEKNDPLEKAKRAQVRVEKSKLEKVESLGARQEKLESSARLSKSALVAGSHVTPVSYGGDNSLSNLTTLCSFHHAQVHQMDLF